MAKTAPEVLAEEEAAEPKPTETITVSKEEYDNLKRRANILTALENGGVDNWDWYSDSLKDFGIDGHGNPLKEEKTSD